MKHLQALLKLLHDAPQAEPRREFVMRTRAHILSMGSKDTLTEKPVRQIRDFPVFTRDFWDKRAEFDTFRRVWLRIRRQGIDAWESFELQFSPKNKHSN